MKSMKMNVLGCFKVVKEIDRLFALFIEHNMNNFIISSLYKFIGRGEVEKEQKK